MAAAAARSSYCNRKEKKKAAAASAGFVDKTVRWLTERDGDRDISHFLNSELDPSGFHGFLRINSDTLQELLDLISSAIATQDTWIRDSISAEQKLVVTLGHGTQVKGRGRTQLLIAGAAEPPGPGGQTKHSAGPVCLSHFTGPLSPFSRAALSAVSPQHPASPPCTPTVLHTT